MVAIGPAKGRFNAINIAGFGGDLPLRAPRFAVLRKTPPRGVVFLRKSPFGEARRRRWPFPFSGWVTAVIGRIGETRDLGAYPPMGTEA